MLVVLGTSFFWQRNSLKAVNYRRRLFYTRGFPDETIALNIQIENNKILPLSWLRTSDHWPKTVGPDDLTLLAPSHLTDHGYLSHVASIRWHGKIYRSYVLRLRKRGVYNLGPLTISSGDLFGFYDNTQLITKLDRITIFPSLLPAEKLDLAVEGPFGDANSRRRLFEDPNRPMGVREYHPEDGFRRIHWPATARTGDLQVKVYQPTTQPVMMLCLNVATSPRYWEGYNPILLERLISITATLADQGIRQGYKVGMISNGCLSNSDQAFRILPGRRPSQLSHLLTALAGVTPITVGSFEHFLVREAPGIPYGASLVVVTASTNLDLDQTLMRLKRHERRVTLISLDRNPPSNIPGVKVIHKPYLQDERESFIQFG
jgi:uncharacterized protein (DUF58 family)